MKLKSKTGVEKVDRSGINENTFREESLERQMIKKSCYHRNRLKALLIVFYDHKLFFVLFCFHGVTQDSQH